MTNSIDNLIPVYLVSDADRLAISEDNVLYMHMLRAKLESDLADMDMDTESVPVRNDRKLSRKERARRHHKANRTHALRDRYHGKRGKEWQYNEYADHETAVYLRGLNGDWNIRGRRLEKTGRPQRVNVHFTDGIPQDTFNMSETDVFQTWSVNSLEYSSMDAFFQYMDNMDWERIPSTVRFYTEWNAEDPFEDTWRSPEFFGMTATLKNGGATVTTKKVQEEYAKFKKYFQTFQKYGEKLRALQQEMRDELRA